MLVLQVLNAAVGPASTMQPLGPGPSIQGSAV